LDHPLKKKQPQKPDLFKEPPSDQTEGRAVQQLFNLSRRAALVTGGAGLLGAEFCRTLAEAGAGVGVADINFGAAEKVAAGLQAMGLNALAIELDIDSPDSVRQTVAAVTQQFGRLDILVNSAAIDPKFDPQHSDQQPLSGAFEDFPLSAWEEAVKVNLTGAFLCCQSAVQPMLAQGGGVIINVSSIYGISGPDQRIYQREGKAPQFKPVYYSVTKAGLLGLTRYLATYYAGKNIRVNALTPGGVYNNHDDEFVQSYSARAVLGRMAHKDEMNGALLFLASDASTYMTGANLVVDGGWGAW
jgi:NAD(P)-dependent dehydrogenase (short-subunit alcohol dehydrogenase family)